MRPFLVTALLVVVALQLLVLWRVWVGPHVLDRVLAVSLVTVNTLVIILLTGTLLDRIETVVDVALGYALLTFVLPIAVGKFLEPRPEAAPEEEAP